MDNSELQQLFSMAKPVTTVTDDAELLGEIDTGGVCKIKLYRDMSRYVYTVQSKTSNWQGNFMQRFNRRSYNGHNIAVLYSLYDIIHAQDYS